MKHRLYDLFLLDNRARAKIYLFAWVGSVVFGTLSLAAGVTVRDAVVRSCVLTLAILSIWTLVYCSSSRLARAPSAIFSIRRLALVSGLVAVAIALGLSTEQIEAAILDNKLRRFVSRQSISEGDADGVANALDNARQDHIRVSATVVSAVGARLLRADEYSRGMHNAAQSVAATQSTLHGAPKNEGRRRVMNLPNYSIYEQCYIPNLNISLDTKAFFGSFVENCVVSYSGGPVIIENSEFRNCEFDFTESSQAKALLLLFTQHNDPDFLYEPNEIMRNFPNVPLIERYERR